MEPKKYVTWWVYQHGNWNIGYSLGWFIQLWNRVDLIKQQQDQHKHLVEQMEPLREKINQLEQKSSTNTEQIIALKDALRFYQRAQPRSTLPWE